jgi:hypothetical protein
VKYWDKVQKELSDFATNENIRMVIIKTNARQIINEYNLGIDYLPYNENWWETVSHGLILTGITAPVLAGNIKTLYIASSYSKEFEGPNGSQLLKDISLKFGDIDVLLDMSEFTRTEKIKLYLKSNVSYCHYLRVCPSPKLKGKKFNCGSCEKCVRTIVALASQNINPNLCGFTSDKNTFKFVKSYLSNNLLLLNDHQLLFWKDIQNNLIYSNIPPDLMEFFYWFKQYDLAFNDTRQEKIILIKKFYYRTKYFGLKNSVGRFLEMMRYNILHN